MIPTRDLFAVLSARLGIGPSPHYAVTAMPSLNLQRTDVVVGVDTHKDEHMAVALDGIGGQLGSHALPATPEGYAALLCWARRHGRLVAFGVEGTGSYGSGLARYLRRQGVRVYEVSRPPRRGERRAAGKSDLIDAEHAAREVLSGTATAAPKAADGKVEVLRLIKVARDTAVKSRTQAIITLKAALVTASDELRAELEGLSDFRLITACAGLAGGPRRTRRARRTTCSARWPCAGSRSTRRSKSTPATSTGSSRRRPRSSRPRSGSGPTARPRC